jgi:hypothetical protein
MSLKIIASGHVRGLNDFDGDELIRRLKQVGIVRRDPKTGEVIERSAAAELAERLQQSEAEGQMYRPDEDEQGTLFAVLDAWLNDLGKLDFPESSMDLRYALYAEIRRSAAAARLLA